MRRGGGEALIDLVRYGFFKKFSLEVLESNVGGEEGRPRHKILSPGY